MTIVVHTIGHSTRTIDEFGSLLSNSDIEVVVDVRTIARSRHNPQYNADSLSDSLKSHDIEYQRLESLGGLRHTTKDSINGAWRNASFRGYADYMQTAEFSAGIDDLMRIAGAKLTVIMCAEAVPWRCHRSLIGDALLVRGITVIDIINARSISPHSLTSFACVSGTSITYPPD
jgi:uncharacterized protein (DUF488 family)